jgi:Tfp pilus assembly protein PilX
MRKIMLQKLKSEGGIALIVALGVLLIMLMLTGVVLNSAVDLSASASRDVSSKRAFEAAQAGLQATLYRMNMNINSAEGKVEELNKDCVGGAKDQVEPPKSSASGSSCLPYTETLGNGASYTSWTTSVFEGIGKCAGAAVGSSKVVAERCITSEGIVERGGQKIKHRVQERVTSFDGRPVFRYSGIVGEYGVLAQQSAEIKGTVASNGTIESANTAKIEKGILGPEGAPNPPVQKNSSEIGQCSPKCLVASEWAKFTPVEPPKVEPEKNAKGEVIGDLTPEGNARITNAFTGCKATPGPPEVKCPPHDNFTKKNGEPCTIAAECGWNPVTRTLELTVGETWEIQGEQYNLCHLILKAGKAKLAKGVSTSIYLDSKSDPTEWGKECTEVGSPLEVNGSAEFINESPPLPGSPLKYNTTALEIWIFGPSNDVGTPSLSNNACVPSVTRTCITLGQGSEFYGTVYAPTSDIKVENKAGTAGSIEGQIVIYNNPGKFTQDNNVESIVTTGALGTYYSSDWHECKSEPVSSSEPMSNC